MLSVFIFLIHLLSCILWSVAMHNDKTMMSELCEDDLDNCFVHVFYEVGALTGGTPMTMTMTTMIACPSPAQSNY